MLIDTHVHLNDKRYVDDRAEVINNFKKDNIEKVITVGYDLTSSKEGFDLSQEYASVYVALGVHPHDAESYDEQFEKFAKLNANNKKVIAIGEIGLDYYYNFSKRDVQKQVFIKQLKLANDLNLPVIIHVRDAYGDALEILKTHKHLLNNSGVIHCFSGSNEFAKEVLKLGLYISFGGPITFKNSNIAEKVLKSLPIEKVLAETDSPYLAPQQKRGKRNEPKYVDFVIDKMAETFNLDKDELIKILNNNAKSLFKKL